MASDDQVDYKALYLQEKEERLQEEALRLQEQERREQAEELLRPTTFIEFLDNSHRLFSLPVRVQIRAKSTRGSIPKPSGKLCPTELREWGDCAETLNEMYQTVSGFFEPTDRLFECIERLRGFGRQSCMRKLGSERDLEFYARLAVESQAHSIFTELCKMPAAKAEFHLGEGVTFENHANFIDSDDPDFPAEDTPTRCIPDQFCIHREEGGNSVLLTTVEYKPPHKLPSTYLRVALRPMNLVEEVVNRTTIPTDKDEKLLYHAEQITASVIVQEYHVMINEGLEYSYITNGLAYVFLWVRENQPGVLYYYRCEPNLDVDLDHLDQPEQLQKTAIARVLCFCLLSCESTIRENQWREDARRQLSVWETNLDYARSLVPEKELRETPPGSEYVPSSPLSSFTTDISGRNRESQGSCGPSVSFQDEDIESSDSDSPPTTSERKRNISQVTTSSATRSLPTRAAQGRSGGGGSGGQRQHTANFCTQRCLLGLQTGGPLDRRCPNVALHREDRAQERHSVDVKGLMALFKQQLDRSVDHYCTPIGKRGGYSAAFKLTCAENGYTVIGKGTTTYRWPELSSEIDIYHVLRKAQGSAVPVFLGGLDLKITYYLHGAGAIRHMLLMGWAGEDIDDDYGSMRKEVERSVKEIRDLGVKHQDLRPENMLWNQEMKRVMIIDFHKSELVNVAKGKRPLSKAVVPGVRRSKKSRSPTLHSPKERQEGISV